MRKSRFSEEQILGILKEGDAGVDVTALTRRHGISRARKEIAYAQRLPVQGRRSKKVRGGT